MRRSNRTALAGLLATIVMTTASCSTEAYSIFCWVVGCEGLNSWLWNLGTGGIPWW